LFHSFQHQLFLLILCKISSFASLPPTLGLLFHSLQDQLFLLIPSNISSFASLPPRSGPTDVEARKSETIDFGGSEAKGSDVGASERANVDFGRNWKREVHLSATSIMASRRGGMASPKSVE
jgi:hypothetical protein